MIASHDLSSSGAPLFAANLARELTAAGLRVTVISPEDGPVRSDLESDGVAVRIAPSMPDFHGTSLLTRLDVSALTRAVDEHDIVLANSIVTSLAINTATAFHKPSILWLHESQFGHKIAVHDSSVRAALRDATRVVLLTPYLAGLYREFLSQNNTVIVPLGLNEAKLAAPGTRPDDDAQLASDKIIIVSVGSIEPRKGQDFLLSSFMKLPDDVRGQMDLHFLGRTVDQEYAQALRQQVDAAANIHFAGNLAHSRIMSYLDAADIFVLSSRDEVLPASLLEAMYHRLAIVATRAGGVPDVIDDGQTGLLVKFGDRRAMTNALKTLALDADLRIRLGENAANAFHARYTIGSFRNRLADLIMDTANGSVAPGAPEPDAIPPDATVADAGAPETSRTQT